MYKYTVTDKQKDITNGNIVVTVNFEDDANPGTVYTQKTWAFDLTDARIDEWARNVISTLATRDANFDGITLNTTKEPDAIKPAVQAAQDAQIAFAKALQQATLKKQITELNDADVDAAYANLVAA